jgi:hypothetical protein
MSGGKSSIVSSVLSIFTVALFFCRFRPTDWSIFQPKQGLGPAKFFFPDFWFWCVARECIASIIILFIFISFYRFDLFKALNERKIVTNFED